MKKVHDKGIFYDSLYAVIGDPLNEEPKKGADGNDGDSA